MAGDHKILVRIANRKTINLLLLEKPYDLSLLCLSRPFWQAAGIANFRAFTVYKMFFFNRV